jgi:hypothetical protein
MRRALLALAVVGACSSARLGPPVVPTFVPLTPTALDRIVRACPPPRELRTTVYTENVLIECPDAAAARRDDYDLYSIMELDFTVDISSYSLDLGNFTVLARDPQRRAEVATMIGDLVWPPWRDPFRAALAEGVRLSNTEGFLPEPEHTHHAEVAGGLVIESWNNPRALEVTNVFCRRRP